MGNDTNRKAPTPTGRGKAIKAAKDPFRPRNVDRQPPRFADVPGLVGTIDALVMSGRAILLASTRDGGALVVQILDEGQRFKAYAASDVELLELFDQLAELVSDDGNDVG